MRTHNYTQACTGTVYTLISMQVLNPLTCGREKVHQCQVGEEEQQQAVRREKRGGGGGGGGGEWEGRRENEEACMEGGGRRF